MLVLTNQKTTEVIAEDIVELPWNWKPPPLTYQSPIMIERRSVQKKEYQQSIIDRRIWAKKGACVA